MDSYKKSFILLKGIIFLMLVIIPYRLYANEMIRLKINNKTVQKDIVPFIESGRTFVPISVIEELGAEVIYNDQKKVVIVKRQNMNIELKDIRNINGHMMVSIRDVAEKLECQIRWHKESKTVYIYLQNINPYLKKGTDQWGRTIKLSNFPVNVQYFPYLCEDIPDWVYELIISYMKNTNKRAWWSGYEIDIYGNPIPKWTISAKNTPNDFWYSGYSQEIYYERLKKYLDFCLNIDYHTLKRSNLKNIVNECIGEKQFKNFDKTVDSWYRYYLNNKIIISGESIIIPEGFHLTDDNLPVLTAYVKFYIQSQSPKNYCLIGAHDNHCNFEAHKTYEGLFICPLITYQGDVNNYKLDYEYLGLDIRDFREVP